MIILFVVCVLLAALAGYQAFRRSQERAEAQFWFQRANEIAYRLGQAEFELELVYSRPPAELIVLDPSKEVH